MSEPGMSEPGASPRRVLVLANLTATGAELAARIRQLMEEQPSRFTLLVPSIAGDRTLIWEENEVWRQAEEQMNRGLALHRGLGAEMEGRVGDRDPVNAVTDLLLTEPHDLILVSTLPERSSRWLSAALPERIAKETGLPVIHVVGAGQVEHTPA
ncbi:MAG: hypothetical protein Q8P18_17390 [Pseudomonadota bacterium]|nr:hypothetical protein [Pseudomonadota bacterium]